MKKLILIFAVLLQIRFVNAQLNGTYLVGASQPFPFNTIKNAVENISTEGVSGAVTFLLTDNLYVENGIEFKTVSGTSVTNTITLRPDDDTDVEIRGSGDFVIGIERTSHLFFEGKSLNDTGSLTISSTETAIGSSVIKFTTPSNTSGNTLNIHVRNCTINAAPAFFSEPYESKAYGFNQAVDNNMVSCDSIIINNNIFTGGDIALNLRNTDIYITNNKFLSAGGIFFSDGSVDKFLKIQNNIFENINLSFSRELSVIDIFGGFKVDIENNNFNGIHYNFTSFMKEFNAFSFTGSKNINITNNIIKNINYNATFTPVPNLDIGSIFRLFLFTPAGNIKIYHNSIYIPIGGENGFVSGDGNLTVFAFDDCQNIDFKNNSIAVLQGNKPGETVNSAACIYNFSSETDIATLNSDNNIYYVANHTYNYFYHVGTQYNDFTQWQSTHPSLDQNSYWEMPNVVSKDDLHLTQDCNRGTPIAEVPLDFEGTVRSTVSPDIGAYELLNILDFAMDGYCQLTLIRFSIINGTNIQSALWNFGDGQTSTLLEPSHTYLNPGTFTVTLTVTYYDNSTKTISKEITVYNQPQQNIILHH